MYELSPNQFSIVLPMLLSHTHKAVYAYSVIERNQRGRIFVNKASEPTAALITSCGGFYCLLGSERDDRFKESVLAFMNEVSNHIGFFALALFTDGWEAELDKSTIHNSKKITRSFPTSIEPVFTRIINMYGIQTNISWNVG